MMLFKKIAILLLCLTLAFSLFACNEPTDDPGNNVGDLPDDPETPDTPDDPDEGDTDPEIPNVPDIDFEETVADPLLEKIEAGKTFDLTLTLNTSETVSDSAEGEELIDVTLYDGTESVKITVALTDNGADVRLAPVTDGEETAHAVYVIGGTVYTYDENLEEYVVASDDDSFTVKVGMAIAGALAAGSGDLMLGDIVSGDFSGLNDFDISYDLLYSRVIFKQDNSTIPNELITYFATLNTETETVENVIDRIISIYGGTATVSGILDEVTGKGTLSVEEALTAIDSYLTENHGTTLQGIYDQVMANDEVVELLVASFGLAEEDANALRSLVIDDALADYKALTIDDLADMLMKQFTADTETAYTLTDLCTLVKNALATPVGTILENTEDLQYVLSKTKFNDLSLSFVVGFGQDLNPSDVTVVLSLDLSTAEISYDGETRLTSETRYAVSLEIRIDSISEEITKITIPNAA